MATSIPFPHRLAGHCASGAFRDLFEFKGYRHDGAALSEAMVFGLGAGLDVMYMPRPTGKTPFYLGGRTAGLEEHLLARVGGFLSRRSEPDNDAAWSFVRERLDRGEPVAMVGDCQKLEYLKTRTSMPLHVIVATGYDHTHALIADNDREEIQRCSLGSLREARSAFGFPLPAMNVTFEIDWPAGLPPLETLVRPAIAQVVAWMHEPDGPAVALFGRETFGLPAMERLERDATAWVTTAPAAPGLCAALLWIAIEKGGTGGAFFRRLWRDFLVESKSISPSVAMSAAAAHYATLADDWSALGASTASGSFAGAAEKLVTLVRGEREGVEMLQRVVREAA